MASLAYLFFRNLCRQIRRRSIYSGPEDMATVHYPLHFFTNRSDLAGGQDGPQSGLVVLNSKFHGLQNTIRRHWNQFSVCACADGGSNCLYDNFSAEERERYIPQFICGDLDSAREEVLDFYKKKGTAIIRLPDQDSTDFVKTAEHLLTLRKSGEQKFTHLYALNAVWGRFDQTLGNINTLYSMQEESEYVELFLVTEDSIIFLLKPGSHIIHVDSELEEGHCGLVPFGQPCTNCTTSGLVWNLKHQSMQVGGLISTSNVLQTGVKQVTVDTSHTLLWTMSHTLAKH